MRTHNSPSANAESGRDVGGSGHLRVGAALPGAPLAERRHVGLEGRTAGLLAVDGADDPQPFAGLGDVRTRAGPTLQSAQGDQQLLRAADDVVADAVLLGEFGPGGEAVAGGPLVARDALAEHVGDAEVRRLIRHVDNLVH